MSERLSRITVVAAILVGFVGPLAAQVNPEDAFRVDRLDAEPSSVTVQAGEAVPWTVHAYDADGNRVHPELRAVGPREGVWPQVEEGQITGISEGNYEVVVSVLLPVGSDAEVDAPTLRVPVEVTWPTITGVEISSGPGRLYEGTHLKHRAVAFHADDSKRPYPEIEWSTSDPSVASVDRFGRVHAHGTGDVAVTATVEGTQGTVEHTIQPFPAERIEVSADREDGIQTGDVVNFEARAFDSQGNEIDDLPITWTHHYEPHDSIGTPGAAGALNDGRFVAESSGPHTVAAVSGPVTGWKSVDVHRRDVVRTITELGQGPVRHRRTSDFWVYEGVDGRDYAVSGTWGSGGFAYFWDVTDPTEIALTDSIQVDARTVNDVKVSPDGRYAVLAREGASDRRNGIVIMDLSDPAHPTVASTYTEGLTGGVHNTYPTDDYLFALSNSEKYVILDVRDIYDPQYVSEYQHPNARVHDVWVKDGLAYSAQWEVGVVVVDIGDGRWGGSIENPVFVTNIPTPSGRTHGIIPYDQESTGRLLLFAGDEIIGRPGRALEAC